jgi:hypothetical protein
MADDQSQQLTIKPGLHVVADQEAGKGWVKALNIIQRAALRRKRRKTNQEQSDE